jgi:hypothetical protein
MAPEPSPQPPRGEGFFARRVRLADFVSECLREVPKVPKVIWRAEPLARDRVVCEARRTRSHLLLQRAQKSSRVLASSPFGKGGSRGIFPGIPKSPPHRPLLKGGKPFSALSKNSLGAPPPQLWQGCQVEGARREGGRSEGYQRFERVPHKRNDTLRKRPRCESNESRGAG